jgi:putative phosphoesterase
MKVLVISDSHGNLVNLNHVLGFAKKYGVTAVIHAGDWNTIESVETVISFGIPLYTVAGNAEVREEVTKKLKVKSKKFSKDFLEIELDEKKIGITHKPSNNKKFFGEKRLDIIFNGHMHSRDESIVNGTKIVRPGAIINGNNFAIYDTKTNRVEFVADNS